jgi:hypothetical protein
VLRRVAPSACLPHLKFQKSGGARLFGLRSRGSSCDHVNTTAPSHVIVLAPSPCLFVHPLPNDARRRPFFGSSAPSLLCALLSLPPTSLPTPLARPWPRPLRPSGVRAVALHTHTFNAALLRHPRLPFRGALPAPPSPVALCLCAFCAVALRPLLSSNTTPSRTAHQPARRAKPTRLPQRTLKQRHVEARR